MAQVRTQQHESLLALAILEARLCEQHQGLQAIDRWLINVKLHTRATCILLASSDCGVVPTEMGCISGVCSVHWPRRDHVTSACSNASIRLGLSYLALTA